MAGNIKGIIVEIGGDTSNLQKALSKIDSATSSLSKELRGVNSLLKLDPSNTELLAQKQELLSKNIDETSEKLKLLKDVQKQADEAMANGTKISEENYRNLQREIASTQNKLNGLTDELKQFNAQNSNWIKAGKKIQDYGEKVSKVSEKIDEAGDKLSVLSAGAVAGGTVLANTAMSLEDALAKYVSSTNTASNETEKYKQVLESINNAGYGEGYEDIADSMTAVSMQIKDIDSQNLENITEKAIALRDLFGYDVSESVRSVKALMDNFNISADEAFNLIAEGKKQGLDFSNELLDNVNEYSVQFKKLGLSAEDMFNIFKTGSENGAFNLDKIGDAIKEFSIRAIDGSNTTIDGFKRIGLNADEMAEKFAEGGETAKKAFIEVVKRLGSMDDKVSQSIAGVDLFGTMWEDLGPTVVTSFSEMDSGISQSSDSMQKSIDELYNTTKKKAEKQLKRLQSLGADFGEEMLPVLEDLIDIAEDFTKKLEGMSDEEKKNIVNIGLFVAGIGPLTKILGTVGTTVGTVTKGIGTFSQAIGVATGKTTSNVTAVNNLATAFKMLGSPLGIIVTATAGAIGIASILADEQFAYADAVSESSKKMKEAIEVQQQFRQSQDENLNANLSEVDNVQKLSDELQTLVDKNGKVKKGYEDRVNFILNELNSALGTEAKLNGNLIEDYDELIDSIDELIQKKKIESILENEEAKYEEAIKNRTAAYDDMIAKENELADAKTKVQEIQDKINNTDKRFGTLIAGYQSELTHAKVVQQQAEENLNNSKTMYQTYLNDIATYENDYAIMMTGTNEEINNLIASRTYTYQQGSADVEEVISHNIQQIQYEVSQYKAAREKDLQNQDEINAQKNQNQIEAGEQQLRNLANQLYSMTSTTEEMTPQQIEAWKNLATGSYAIYSEYVSNLPKEMRKKIQEATGVVVANTDEFAEQAGIMGKKVVNEFDKNGQAKTEALKTLQGYYEGLNDKEKKELLKATVGDRADEVAKEFEKGDYETSGKNVLEGIYKGLNNGTLGQSLIDKAAGIAKSIANQFNIQWDEHSPSKLMKKKTEYLLEPIPTVMDKRKQKLIEAAQKLAKGITDSFSNSFSLDSKLINSDLNNMKLNKSTSDKIIGETKSISNYYKAIINVQELDEARLEQCFNYFNRRFGIQY